MTWLRTLLAGVWPSRTSRERNRFDDGTPRQRVKDDGMARLTLIKGIAPGKQRVIRAENER